MRLLAIFGMMFCCAAGGYSQEASETLEKPEEVSASDEVNVGEESKTDKGTKESDCGCGGGKPKH